MKHNVNEYDFVNAFDQCDRTNNFTRTGRFALYEYLIEIEEDCGIEIELDPIAICCGFTEYDNIAEFNDNYNEEFESTDDLYGHVTVIEGYDDFKFIIEDY